jgi:hypothetical protein
MSKLPAIPPIPAGADPQTRQWMESVSEALAVRTGQRGDPLDAAVTRRELNDVGLLNVSVKGRQVPSAGSSSTGNVSLEPGATLDPADNALVNEAIPNNPANVKLTATENYIIIDYAPPQDFVAHTEVWVSEDSELSNAVMVGVINTRPWGYKPPDNEGIYRFWLRHVSYRNKYSGFVSVSGSWVCDPSKPDDLTVNTLTVATATIGQGEIGNLLIGDAIQSDNYVPGVSGWIIKK